MTYLWFGEVSVTVESESREFKSPGRERLQSERGRKARDGRVRPTGSNGYKNMSH